MTTVQVALVAGLLLAGTAGAARAGGSAMDADGDGTYSLEELQIFYPTLDVATYARIDSNGDGAVSPSEFRRGQDEGLLPVPYAAE